MNVQIHLVSGKTVILSNAIRFIYSDQPVLQVLTPIGNVGVPLDRIEYWEVDD